MDYLIDGQPDAVVVVVDAGNLERNLYLTFQIVEMGLPTLVVLNMMDSAAARGLRFDTARLSARLGGAAVIPAVARREQGVDALSAALLGLMDNGGQPGRLRRAAGRLRAGARSGDRAAGPADRATSLADRGSARWLAVKLLEGDTHVAERLSALPGTADLLDAAA